MTVQGVNMTWAVAALGALPLTHTPGVPKHHIYASKRCWQAARLAPALGSNLRVLLLQLQLEEPRAQQRKRALLVLALAALLRTEDADACARRTPQLMT